MQALTKPAIKSRKDKTADLQNDIETEAAQQKKTSSLQLAEDFLKAKYDFRFNILTCNTEFKTKKQKEYNDLDRYFFNSILREMKLGGYAIKKEELEMLLSSDFIKRADPIKEYIHTLPEWDGINYIGALCDTVNVYNSEHWQNFFTKWIVAVFANALDDQNCANHCCLVLTGGQGAYKTTWLNNLCSNGLRKYIFTGRLDLDVKNKDTMSIMAEHLFVNIDDQLWNLHFHKQREDDLKNLITLQTVKYRRPYDRSVKEYPHLSSFMGSVNRREFLTDSTGSRRFLSFEVMSIEIDRAKRIDMDKVYSQALHLLRSGFQYWFAAEEVKTIEQNNSIFKANTIEEELILRHYTKPEHEWENTYLTATDIKSHLEEISRQKISLHKLGEALGKLGYEKQQKRFKDEQRAWVYCIKEISGIEKQEDMRKMDKD